MPTPAAKEEPHLHASYVIDPIHEHPPDDDAIMRLGEEAWAQAGYAPLPPMRSVIGWRLTLRINGHDAGQREHASFDDAQRDGAAWLQRHGSDGISQWIAQAAQASRRMGWDHDYHHAMSKRGF